MNSEELEQSLRTEFDSYFENILEDMAEEVSQFQQKIDAELEKHKVHLNEVFQEFSTRLRSERKLDAGFSESVVEHLRLARDEGARITATAIAEAEELTKAEQAESAPAATVVDLSGIRDAVNDISSQSSQSSILKSLISHASNFTPRGAFFVVKNNHFVGWRIFGNEQQSENDSITDIVFPVDSSTVLGESVRALSAVKTEFGTYDADADYLRQLGFSEPGDMYAVPLIARGRGVAAIYADGGDSGEVNLEALETLVSVAGLTVELLAAAQSSNVSREAAAPPAEEEAYGAAETDTETDYYSPAEVSESSEAEYSEVESVQSSTEYSFAETDEVEEGDDQESAEFEGTDDFQETSYDVSAVEESEDEVEEARFDSDVQEVEVEEVSADADEIEDEAEVAFAAGEVSDEAEFEPSYSFSSEQPSDNVIEEPEEVSAEYDEVETIETLQNEYAAYDDDLIEEVQTQSDHSAFQEESEFVDAADEDSVESEVEPVSFDTTESDEDLVESEQTGSYSFRSGTDSFETNQDLNSSPVAYEESFVEEETFEPVSQPEDVQEVSFDDIQSEEESVSEPVREEIEEAKPEPAPAPSFRTRFSDRNLDLPIEVSEDERRLHNDARRFARLLVSEIKLYNEQKVKEGRESNDLYDRLREALDRSREMYDKRVQPAVVERFDYFHYEVVNTLAEGEEARLGSAYPGATVGA